MPGEPSPLTAASTIEEWLAHDEGGPLIRGVVEQAGFDEQALAPAGKLPLQQLVTLSQGEFSQEAVDDLVRRANGGTMPPEDAAPAPAERIAPGRFTGRTVVVTGAASGIGRATASRVAREGGRVVAVDVSAERLGELAAEVPESDVDTVVADLTDPAHIQRILDAAGENIDALANVAGINDDFSPVHEVTDEMWENVFALNVGAVFRLTRAVVPTMLAAGRGSLVNVASEAALRGSASGAAYTASKHAVVGLTRSSAFMYGPHGLRVNAVAPGGVATGMPQSPSLSEFGRARTGELLATMPPVATAEQLSASITFLLSDDSANINGAVLPSDGGWSAQ